VCPRVKSGDGKNWCLAEPQVELRISCYEALPTNDIAAGTYAGWAPTGHYVAVEHLQTLAASIRAIITDDPGLSLFRGFMSYFSAKDLKAIQQRFDDRPTSHKH
jgi:hypothetical protein